MLEASEESQLEAAIQASLREASSKPVETLVFESDSDADIDTFDVESSSDSEQVWVETL